MVQYQDTLESAIIFEAVSPLSLLLYVTQQVFVPEIRGARWWEEDAIQTQGLVLASLSGGGT